MNADAFRSLYEYHFSENRKLWEKYVVPLSWEQFTRPAEYSHGSVRAQLVHLMDVDEVWFAELQGSEPSTPLPEPHEDDRARLRAHWDEVECSMRGYLAGLRDEMLSARPIREPEEDRGLAVWQVLWHVVNHGTDHRAQLLRQLHDLGAATKGQDFIFYVYEHMRK